MKENIKDKISIEFLPNYVIENKIHLLEGIKRILISNNQTFIPTLYERIEFKGTLEEKVNYRIQERLNNYHYILAIYDEEVVGFTEFRTDDSSIGETYHYCINVGTSAVHLDFQGYGIAKMLYKELDELAMLLDVDAVLRSTWTMNSKQIKLYESFGYREIERLENSRGEGNHLVKYCKWFK